MSNKPAYSTRGEREFKGNVGGIYLEGDLWYKRLEKSWTFSIGFCILNKNVFF
jgi:hypothetical protein